MKKLLIISPTPTHPTNAGNRQCILSFADLLKEIGYEIYFMYVTYNTNDNSFNLTKEYWKEYFIYKKITPLQRFLTKIIRRIFSSQRVDLYMFQPWMFKKFIKNIDRKYKFDSVLINYIWLSNLANAFKTNNISLFTHDVFTYRNLRLMGKYWFSCTPNQEAKCINRVKNVLAIQEQETIYYKYLSYKTKVYCVYSPFKFIEKNICCNKNLLFFSGPNIINIVAIEKFIYEIMPSIVKEIPNIKLYIGGGICNELKNINFKQYIILKGAYDNPDDFYNIGDICINPINEGTGLKIKTFEALSYGKTVIASKHSIEGVYNQLNCPVLIAETANEYVNYIKEYLTNEDKLIVKRENARKYINELNNYISNTLKAII